MSKPKDEEYESYLRRVKENPLARQVKLADLAHNTSPERASGLNEKRRAKYELAKRILTEANAIKCPKCGKGFDFKSALKKKSHFGLKNIQTRAENLHGTVAFNSEPNEGTQVAVIVPY